MDKAHLIHALISRESYKKPDERDNEIKGFYYIPELSTPYRAVYENDDKRIIGYRGTDLKDTQDLIDDAFIIKGQTDKIRRLNKELKEIDKIKHETKTTELTGHSLGALISNKISHTKDLKHIGFNEPLNQQSFLRDLIDHITGDKTRTRYSHKKDLIGRTNLFSKNLKYETKKPHSIDELIKNYSI